jgi:general secretion pathway protein E
VIELINLILLEPVKDEASDVHLQPFRDHMVVRYRIDGVLFDAHKLPKDQQEEAVSRVKIMGNMNIAEKRLPQDGRASVTVGDRAIDLRIASLPGSYGERVVIRLLDKTSRVYALTETGMDTEAADHFRHLIHQEHGLILLTGPTCSGKTTTLYAALQELNQRERNIVTLEDPVEYEIDGISQTQINVRKGMTFASGIRSVLRQDPDVIMVGEIRDQETAALAIQSSLTGHLVFSTLHTNDAASAVTRLLHLGVEPYLVSSSLLAVLAQRLVRRVCDHCGVELSSDELKDQLTKGHLTKGHLQVADEQRQLMTSRQGPGCEHCRQTGYRGRVAITELLTVDNEIRSAVQGQQTASEIQATARNRGMRLLREDGIDKVGRGITTVDEVARVTVRDN